MSGQYRIKLHILGLTLSECNSAPWDLCTWDAPAELAGAASHLEIFGHQVPDCCNPQSSLQRDAQMQSLQNFWVAPRILVCLYYRACFTLSQTFAPDYSAPSSSPPYFQLFSRFSPCAPLLCCLPHSGCGCRNQPRLLVVD